MTLPYISVKYSRFHCTCLSLRVSLLLHHHHGSTLVFWWSCTSVQGSLLYWTEIYSDVNRQSMAFKFLVTNADLWVTSYSGMFWLDYLTFFGNDPCTSTECHLFFQTSHPQPMQCRLCNLQSHLTHHNTITQLLTLSPYSSITLMLINNNDVLFCWKNYILLFNRVNKKIFGFREIKNKDIYKIP
jgi:hypothetical protein